MSKSANFSRFNVASLSSPFKPLIREALRSAGAAAPDSEFTVGVKLQKGGGVSRLFETQLLADPRINRFNPVYKSVSQLCLRWGKERGLARQESANLDPQSSAVVRRIEAVRRSFRTMADVEKSASREHFTVISLFAGGGGSSIGYKSAGGKVLIANEFISEAALTYKRNNPGTIVNIQDIRVLLRDPSTIEALLASCGLRYGCLDVLDGSPPCSEFSIAGKGPADPSISKRYSDGEQRDISGLPLDYARFALIVRPRVLVMENVPGLATRGRAILTAIENALRADYYVAWRILNANDYSVPQSRRRVFLLGVRKDVGAKVGIDNDRDVERVFPNPTDTGQTIRTAFDDLSQTSDDLRPWFNSARTSYLERAVRLLPKNPIKPTRPVNVTPGETRNFTLTRCAWDRAAPTLTVTAQQPNGLAGAVHPDQDRKFSIPEMKRLFGLPDDFVLTGSLAQGAERICRMVPPPLTQAIAESIYERVLLPYKESDHEGR